MAFQSVPTRSHRIWNFAVFANFKDVSNFEKSGKHRDWVNAVMQPYPMMEELLAAIDLTKNIAKNIDLGGAFTKSKLFITDNSAAVFDFGLASSGLKRLVEFYSVGLAKQYPLAFVDEGYLPGCIPPVLIARDETSGQYFLEFNDEIFVAERRQMGTTYAQTLYPQIQLTKADGLVLPENATNPEIAKLLKYTSSQKRSYVEMRKMGGVAPYIDIVLPLNFLSGTTSTEGMLGSILPAIIAAEIFEQAGIQTRIYVGRIIFTQPGQKPYSDEPYAINKAIEFEPKTLFGVEYPHAKVVDYIDILPPQNRAVLINVKERGQETNWNLIGQLIANVDLRGGFAAFAADVFPNDNHYISTNYVTYADANLMDAFSKNFGGWLNFIAANDLYGDYRPFGSFTSNGSEFASEDTKAKIGPTPIQNIIGTFLSNVSYNIRQDFEAGIIAKMNHPFGFFFWRILDRAELMLSANPNKVISRIYKRLIAEGYTNQEVQEYMDVSVLGIVNRMTVDPVEAFTQNVRKPYDNELQPPYYYPYNEQTKKMIQAKAKALRSAYDNITNKLV